MGSANTLGVEPSGSGGASDSLTAIQAVKRMFYDDSVVGDSPRLSREELLRAIYKVVAPFDSAEAAATTKYTQPPRTT